MEVKLNTVNIIGAGLAGCEAAWQAASLGVKVKLYEMKPLKFSPAHSSPLFAELVCSNSFRSNQLTNAVGLLKEELRRLNSLFMEAARSAEVPAGSALAVDRNKFSGYITDKIRSHENIEVINKEITSLPAGEVTVIATGPLTSEALSERIAVLIGFDCLHFYDAAAPIIEFSSIDRSKIFFASRYGKGEASYINCPMTKAEYDAFYEALISAETAPLHGFEENLEPKMFTEPKVFEGCMPVEVMAARGYEALRFGPMKPVGLIDPSTDGEAYAVVQLRTENNEGAMYNMVGFQTRLTFSEQRRVFGMIPGLENAVFLRYGVMHRNTFINSPKLLRASYEMRENPGVFFAGQITGVEGYTESAASGLAAGINAARKVKGLPAFIFPAESAVGALAAYISNPAVTDFQPMNVNFGLFPPLRHKVKGGKQARQEVYAERALSAIDNIVF